MKKDRILPIFFFSLTLFLISFIFGYQLMSKKLNPKSISKVSEKETDMSKHSGREILNEESRISPNTFIEERIHYTACDHVVTKVEVVEDEFVDLNKRFQEKLNKYNDNEEIQANIMKKYKTTLKIKSNIISIIGRNEYEKLENKWRGDKDDLFE